VQELWLGFNPQCGIKAPLLGPWFVLALAGIRRLAEQIKALEKDDLLPKPQNL